MENNWTLFLAFVIVVFVGVRVLLAFVFGSQIWGTKREEIFCLVGGFCWQKNDKNTIKYVEKQLKYINNS